MTNYGIYRFDKRYGSKLFKDYEKARQHVRKAIREMYAADGTKVNDKAKNVVTDTRWSLSNPSIGDFGFSIKTTVKN